MGALAGMMRQSVILRLQLRGEAVTLGFVEQLVDLGDGYTHRAGGAMVAVSAVATLVGSSTGAHIRVVFLRLGGV